jgi:hypothetical protein
LCKAIPGLNLKAPTGADFRGVLQKVLHFRRTAEANSNVKIRGESSIDAGLEESGFLKKSQVRPFLERISWV